MSFIINSTVIVLVVLIHYEVLRQISIIIPKLSIRPRFKVVFGVLGSLCGHVIEIWLFGFVYFGLIYFGYGDLTGNYTYSIMDSVYFSFSTYTSLGFGDIEPKGQIRFLAGLEALLGLVMITWTASFMYLEMIKYWRDK